MLRTWTGCKCGGSVERFLDDGEELYECKTCGFCDTVYEFQQVEIVDEEYCKNCDDETEHELVRYDSFTGEYTGRCKVCKNTNEFEM